MSQAITVQVDAIAQAPSLTMTPPATTVSRQVFATDLDGVCNDGTDPTVLDCHHFDGWTLTPTSRRMDPAYCVWDDGDQLDDGQGNGLTLNGTGDTQSWFGLSNDIGGEFQMPGLGRDIQTMAGATYTLNFDYALIRDASRCFTITYGWLSPTTVKSKATTHREDMAWQFL